MRLSWAVLAAVLIVAGPGMAATLTEDFESFSPGAKPDQNWYDYTEADDVGDVDATELVIFGNQSMFWNRSVTTGSTLSNRVGQFSLGVPSPLDEMNFTVEAVPPSNSTTNGTEQIIQVQSGPPRRTVVEFYVFCSDASSPDGCELRVRFDHVDSTGQVLINASANQTRFNIRMVFDWINGEYQLFVDGVDDGVFPFLELPQNVGRIKFAQHRADLDWRMSFDNWTVVGAVNSSGAGAKGDVATGIQNFAEDIRFTTSGSLFFLGLLIWLVMVAAVVVPLLSLGMDNTVLPAVGFFGVLCALWLVFMEFWPDWIGISLIIIAAAVLALTIRSKALGVRDASSGSSMVLGSLGYFVIASSLLAFSGYATDTISMPVNPSEQLNDAGGNVTDTQQTFVGAVTECIFSGGAFTFGLVGDCSQDTTTTTWKKITDAAGQIYGWVQASVDFVFQLLTFRLPIPTLFNIIIIGPPAMALAAYAIGMIRGTAT